MLLQGYPYIINLLKLEFWMELRINRQPQLCVIKMTLITILNDTFYCCLVLDNEVDIHEHNKTHFTHCQTKLMSEIKMLHTFVSNVTHF